MKKSYWTGIMDSEKIAAIREICSVIDKYAIILNFQRFSDVSIGLVIEVEECKQTDLFDSLSNIMRIEGHDQVFTDSKADCTVLLNVTFTRGTGDLLIEVPNIPD
jgi:hypothetical protein